jgi:two-component system OmpR family sensor kinase
VADASHELRTPITAIRGHAQLLVREPERIAGAQRIRTLERIDRQAMHLADLVDHLLDLARLDEGAEPARERVDVRSVAREAVAAAVARDGERSYVLVDGDDVVALADPIQLRRLFDNLLANAGVHTPPGTHVTVHVRREDDQLVLRVEDDGPGIPDADLVDATERFWRARESRASGAPGTGLGLPLVRGIAEAHGGELRLSRSDGGGLAARVHLPLVES